MTVILIIMNHGVYRYCTYCYDKYMMLLIYILCDL